MRRAGQKVAGTGVVGALESFIGDIPGTIEPAAKDPEARCRILVRNAAVKAAAVSGTLAIPPGAAGLLTIIPDMLVVWKIQAQMVADVAGAHGRGGVLSKEEMLYCLFRHSSGRAVKDFIVRAGERMMVRRTSGKAVEQALEKIGARMTERLLGRAASRWLPIVGAIGVGAWAFYDTARAGKTAMELFRHRVIIQPEQAGT